MSSQRSSNRPLGVFGRLPVARMRWTASWWLRWPPRGHHSAPLYSTLAQVRVISRMPARRCEIGVTGQPSDDCISIRTIVIKIVPKQFINNIIV